MLCLPFGLLVSGARLAACSKECCDSTHKASSWSSGSRKSTKPTLEMYKSPDCGQLPCSAYLLDCWSQVLGLLTLLCSTHRSCCSLQRPSVTRHLRASSMLNQQPSFATRLLCIFLLLDP
ncbi:uncharacterized protein LOC119453642 [Dermacentor silvarum]|uniref:uncharacterized protein LOC119453642 n=1 Tax=Dermacentor silvarum TaxID=543639 RepID=UPI002100E7BF|nr:uncharacterized protein LOC119453642 [Dermacentor silvarum]